MQRRRRHRQPHSSTPGVRAMQGQTTLVLTLLFLGFVCLASGTTDVATRTALMEVKRDNAELKTDNAELKRDNAEIKRDNAELNRKIADLSLLMTEILAALLRQSMTSCGLDNLTTSESGQGSSGGGATYIRWGRTSCPAESNLVYKGYVGGDSHAHTGRATNHVCLPEDPQFSTTVLPPHYAEMWGAEYESDRVIFRSDIHNQDVPCAVCRSPTRSSAIMIPARTSCYPGLHLEYNGYLMTSYPHHIGGAEYICVDGNPEAVPGGESNQHGDLLYFTVGRCGTLKCPPYIEKRVLSCVVCSQ